MKCLMVCLSICSLHLYPADYQLDAQWHTLSFKDACNDQLAARAVVKVDVENRQWLAALIKAPEDRLAEQAQQAVKEQSLTQANDLINTQSSSRQFSIITLPRDTNCLFFQTEHAVFLNQVRKRLEQPDATHLQIMRGYLQRSMTTIFADLSTYTQLNEHFYFHWPQDQHKIAHIEGTQHDNDVRNVAQEHAIYINLLSFILKRGRSVSYCCAVQ